MDSKVLREAAPHVRLAQAPTLGGQDGGHRLAGTGWRAMGGAPRALLL